MHSLCHWTLPGNVFIIATFCTLIPAAISIRESNESNTEIGELESRIHDKIFDKYDKRINPCKYYDKNGHYKPTNVSISIHVLAITDIDEVRLEVTVQMILRQRWTDSRLSFREHGDRITYLTLDDANKIWKPDSYFMKSKVKSVSDSMPADTLIRIYYDGLVLLSSRISVTLMAPMNFENFPFDSQSINLMIESYGWSSSEHLIMNWQDRNPVNIATDIHILKFRILGFHTNVLKVIPGGYTALVLKMDLVRVARCYVPTIYAPCFAFVIISWVSFWLDEKAALARISLGLAALLGITIQTYGVTQLLPPISYIKAIDLWIGTCVVFVWIAFLQCLIVQQAVYSTYRKLAPKIYSMDQTIDWDKADRVVLDLNRKEIDDAGRPCIKRFFGCLDLRRTTRARKIDYASRLLFPLAFLAFNIYYWKRYLA